ncbi:adenosine receptor A2a-like [Oculina patagonica]
MSVWFWIICWIISTIAIVGNGTVIYVVLTRETLRTTANIFISSLAFSDLGVGFCAIPGSYFAEHLSNESAMEGIDYLHSIFFTASVLNLCMMTVDRYIAIAFPYKYLSLMTRGRVAFLVSFSWLIPILTSLTPLLWITADQEQAEKANSIFYPTISLFFVLTSYVILIPATLHVYLITRRHFHRITAVNQQLKFNHGRLQISFRAMDTSSSKLLMIAAIVFIFCYSAQLSQEICDLCADCSSFPDLTVFLLLLNSAINPFVYAIHKRDIKRELKCLFESCCSY